MTANQPNTQFIIHRGSHQIGGNCVELATRNARILIDCGLPLDYDEQDVETQRMHKNGFKTATLSSSATTMQTIMGCSMRLHKAPRYTPRRKPLS